MKAVILAAGFGTRLEKSLQTYLQDKTISEEDKKKVLSWIGENPKGLVLIEGQPLITHLLAQLREAGLKNEEIYLHTNSQYHSQFLSWAKKEGLPENNIINNGRYHNGERRGAIGDLYYALEIIGDKDPLLVMASDIVNCVSYMTY